MSSLKVKCLNLLYQVKEKDAFHAIGKEFSWTSHVVLLLARLLAHVTRIRGQLEPLLGEKGGSIPLR